MHRPVRIHTDAGIQLIAAEILRLIRTPPRHALPDLARVGRWRTFRLPRSSRVLGQVRLGRHDAKLDTEFIDIHAGRKRAGGFGLVPVPRKFQHPPIKVRRPPTRPPLRRDEPGHTVQDKREVAFRAIRLLDRVDRTVARQDDRIEARFAPECRRRTPVSGRAASAASSACCSRPGGSFPTDRAESRRLEAPVSGRDCWQRITTA